MNQIRDSLNRKETIKRQKKAERKATPSLPELPDSLPIPITVQDEGEYVNYPLSKSDVEAILELLPTGIGNGLSGIVFCLGKASMQEHKSDFNDPEPDPFTGRASLTYISGLYIPPVLGAYYFNTNRIFLYAYIYDGKALKCRELECYLKLKMLKTLLHELSHHDDQMRRAARGRWLGCKSNKAEDFAIARQQTLVSDALISFLNGQYGPDLSKLSAWIEEHGGCNIPLADLIKDGVIFTIQEAVEGLFANVLSAESPARTRYQFAELLHFARWYEEALHILNELLKDDPANTEATLLIADIQVHRLAYDRAEEIVEPILQAYPGNTKALEILCDVLFARQRWPELVVKLDRLLTPSDEGGNWRQANYLGQQILACLHLGDLNKAEAAWLAYPDKASRHKVRKSAFQSLLLLQKGQYEEAMKVAVNVIQKKISLVGREKTIAKYVFNTAAVKLGKGDNIRQLSKSDRLVLGNLKLEGLPSRFTQP